MKIQQLIESRIPAKDIVGILESGQEAGSLELVKTSVDDAEKYADKVFKANGRELSQELPNFKSNYVVAKSKANLGKTQRKDMPVINDGDVKQFQNRLLKGTVDFSKPYAEDSPKNPFPQGLSGVTAQKWLENGLATKDGNEKDDRVSVSVKSVAAKDLKPIQKQIYYDKSINQIAKSGVKGTKNFMKSTMFITSSDNYIIDGHHRFLSAVLADPNLKVKVLSIDLPIAKLLPLSLAYGDAIGNKRNA